MNNNNEYRISIKNTVDANDPTIELGTKDGYGDMVFRGNVENVNGIVSFVNNTGNILSDGSITAKDLKISVPNGGYTQNYSTNTVIVGGDSSNGAIIASGDIDIASKIIDLNGLVQSGSEIKSVTIPEFTVIKKGEDYYQVVNGVETKMEKGVSDGYYYLNLEGNGQLDSDLEMIKAYFKPSDTSDVNNVKGDIHLFKAEIQGGNITLTGNVVLSSAGNITNAAIDEDKANVSADNIVLNAKNDIGSPIKYFTVDTKSNDLAQGLTYGAQNAYIKGLHNDLNVIESSVNGISNITAADGLSIAVQNSTAGESLNINSTADTVLTGDISAKNITVKSKDETKLSNYENKFKNSSNCLFGSRNCFGV